MDALKTVSEQIEYVRRLMLVLHEDSRAPQAARPLGMNDPEAIMLIDAYLAGVRELARHGEDELAAADRHLGRLEAELAAQRRRRIAAMRLQLEARGLHDAVRPASELDRAPVAEADNVVLFAPRDIPFSDGGDAA